MSKITFEQGKEEIFIMRDRKRIGQIFIHQSSSGENTIQICGFDRVDGPWGCGIFDGQKDLCLVFDKKCEHNWWQVGVQVKTAKTVHQCSLCKLYKVEE